jgi:4-aminobutyrate aminotransferase
VRNRQTMERATDEAEQVMYHCLSNGLNFKLTMGNILTLTPALTITKEELDRALGTIGEALAAVAGQKS